MMKIRNDSKQARQVFDEHAGRGELVEPGAVVELSEQTARELLEHKEIWKPVGTTSTKKKKES